jgi:hypothetical protein
METQSSVDQTRSCSKEATVTQRLAAERSKSQLPCLRNDGASGTCISTRATLWGLLNACLAASGAGRSRTSANLSAVLVRRPTWCSGVSCRNRMKGSGKKRRSPDQPMTDGQTACALASYSAKSISEPSPMTTHLIIGRGKAARRGRMSSLCNSEPQTGRRPVCLFDTPLALSCPRAGFWV